MKKAIGAFTLLCFLLCALISCGETNYETTLDETTDTVVTEADTVNITTDLQTETVMAVEDVMAYFDTQIYYFEKYDSQMIASIRDKLTLEGDLTSVIYIINSQTTSPDLEWVYVYELTHEYDAIEMEENRRAFVSSLENGVCVRHGNIVVFGNSPVIETVG